MTDTTFTVGDLRRELKGLSDDTKLSFDGGLTFGRLKRWGDDEFILLFSEPQADLDPKFRKKNPHVKVAFISNEATEWDERGMIGMVNVSIR